jgi:hypothetical protein
MNYGKLFGWFCRLLFHRLGEMSDQNPPSQTRTKITEIASTKKLWKISSGTFYICNSIWWAIPGKTGTIYLNV